ncbi:uncharacterized protein LOC111276135 [Durio zibethinus]|uniref:Uncharacterized protein LOC111276135 n=1 Tax=Durio zibethinus TaxID=66656 RepID=A0A6P5WNU7_DURZI|nr:uncharacterized protein LOC111276135 [Durio zibethinus]
MYINGHFITLIIWCMKVNVLVLCLTGKRAKFLSFQLHSYSHAKQHPKFVFLASNGLISRMKEGLFLKMANEHLHSIFQICRDEKLVSPKGGKIIFGTARFLKPCVQTVAQAVTVPDTPLLFELFSENLKQLPENVDIKGWHIPQKRWEEWVDRMAGKYGALWKLTGICDAIMSSRYEIRCNKDLLLGLVEFWCPETNTFVFPWGEATVTLEDVMVLGGFSTLGESVRRPLEGKLVKIEEEMNKKRLILSRDKSKKASHSCWIKHFMEEQSEFEHVAFLSLWLSRYVFPSLPEKIVAKQVLPVAIHLSSKTRIALAPAVLASLYKSLTLLQNQAMSSPEEITASGPLKLLQLWAFERFPSLGPSIPNALKPGEPRAARFHRLNAKISLPLVRSVVRLSDNFRYRPYVADLKNWGHPSYYQETKFLAFHYNDPDEDLKSFARCLHTSVLVGIDCKEEYFPHRVAMQFGYDQDLPAAFPVSSISWENVRFALLPRSFQPCVSVRYFNWWARSNSARKAALGDIKRNQNISPTSVPAKRNVESRHPSNEFGVKKPKKLETKVSMKAETEGCCSSFANDYAAKTRSHTIQDCNVELDHPMYSLHPATISSQKIISPPFQLERTKVDSKDPAAMCSLKSNNTFAQVYADNNSEESHASAAPELSSKVKGQAYEEHSDTDHISLSERMKHVSGTPKKGAGLYKSSPCYQFRTSDSPTSRVLNGNPRKRKFSLTITGSRKATTLPFDGNAGRQVNAGDSDQKIKRIIKEGTKAFDHTNGPLDRSEHEARVEQKKIFLGSLKGIGKERKARMAEGFPRNSKNVTFKDTTTTGSIEKFGLELEGRLRRLEKLAGIPQMKN